MSVSQKQKSIRSLHDAAIAKELVKRPLEISSRSEVELGRSLSAFNLTFKGRMNSFGCVETAFQGSKAFEFGGPFEDLYMGSARSAKKDERIRNSGKLKGFRFDGENWPLQPLTIFYDWLYLNALSQNAELADQIVSFDSFTDIEFNPKKSINCQAASVALYISLKSADRLAEALISPSSFKSIVTLNKENASPKQASLF